MKRFKKLVTITLACALLMGSTLTATAAFTIRCNACGKTAVGSLTPIGPLQKCSYGHQLYIFECNSCGKVSFACPSGHYVY